MESAVERPQKSSARRSRTQHGARLYGATARSRSYLINAVVGRVAPRAPSRGLEKDWLSLKIGRLGARGATRPTIYELASTVQSPDPSGASCATGELRLTEPRSFGCGFAALGPFVVWNSIGRFNCWTSTRENSAAGRQSRRFPVVPKRCAA